MVHSVVECPSCGLIQKYDQVRQGEVADCHRCGRELFRHPITRHLAVPFAFAVTSAILYFMMLFFPLLSVSIYGRENSLRVLNGAFEFVHQGWQVVGILVGLVVVFLPLFVIALMLLILWFASRPRLPFWFVYMLYGYKALRPWSMIEVYILGVFVAYTKLSDMAYVHLDYALYAIILLMVSMSIMDASVDFQALWARCSIRFNTINDQVMMRVKPYEKEELPDYDHMLSCEACHLVFVTEQAIGPDQFVAECPRCGKKLYKRKQNSINRSLALLLAAFIFYIPANLYPIMTMTMMGKESSHRIFQGVIELWQSHMIPLSLLVFFASITVPVLKIAGIAAMIGSSLFQLKGGLVFRSRLFQAISFVGRWSMIDVFMISILIALIQFDALANVQAEFGIVAFAAVVVLTIFAADVFDPRLMWDYAGMNDGESVKESQGKRSR